MKRYIIFVLGLLVFISCQEEELDTFSGKRYIYFSNSVEKDSISLSFFFYPGQNKIIVPVEVSLAGIPLDQDLEYKITSNEEYTTADNQCFKIPDELIFEKGKIKDTVNIELINNAELKSKEVKLLLQLEDNENFITGPIPNRFSKIIFSDIISQPEWWTEDVIDYYLGKYSDEKFKLFIQVTGVGNLSGLGASEVRSYAIQFKYYLIKEKEAGRTVYEKDGSEMEVTVIG